MNFRPWLVALIVTLPAAPAWAGLFDDDEARRQVAELRRSVETLTLRVEGTSQNQIDFANQTEALRAELSRLTGQVEVIANSLESAHKRQQDFYVDLDNRLRRMESTGAPPAIAAGAANPTDPQAEMRGYEAALGFFREGRFKEAQTAFESFVTQHPQSAMQPNAHYWLGSSLYQQKQYDAAARVFGHVATTWPSDAKAPDAMLAQANALVGAKNIEGAVKALEMLVEKYPTSPVVETARARIKTYAPKKKR